MKYSIEGATLTDIADAIRAKAGTSGAIAVSDMPDAIRSITGGSTGGESGGSDDDGNWLFEDEYLTTELRTDLPAPVVGTSYTLFVNGEEKVTKVAENNDSDEIQFFWRDGCVTYSIGGWAFYFDPPSDFVTESGTVSIRINETANGEWTLASDGMGALYIENGYLYTDAEPMYLEDEEENVAGSFEQSDPLDLSRLDTGKVYSVWDAINSCIVTALFYKQTEDEWALDFVSDDYNTLYIANGYLRSYDVTYYLGEQMEDFVSRWGESLDLSKLDKSIRYMLYADAEGSEAAELYYIG